MSTMKIYTKTGDKGETSLFGGKRIKKSSLRVNAYGSIDELNAYIGLCMAYIASDESVSKVSMQKHINLTTLLTQIQGKLFCIGSLTARDTAKPLSIDGKLIQISESDVELLERSIDSMDKHIPELTHFILPTGTVIASHFQIARTIARRAERVLVALQDKEEVAPNCVKYINRLSDLLFTLARFTNALQDGKEVKWEY